MASPALEVSSEVGREIPQKEKKSRKKEKREKSFAGVNENQYIEKGNSG